MIDFYEVFVRTPVNGSAAKMLSSSDIIEEDITNDELNYLISRLVRKRRLLNQAIGVKTKAQRKNLKLKMNKGLETYRGALFPRSVDEWKRNGLAILKLNKELMSRNNQDNQTT